MVMTQRLKRQLPVSGLLMGLAVLTAACGDDGDDTETGQATDTEEDAGTDEAPAADADELLDRTFVSVNVTEDGAERQLVEDTEIEITFHDDPASLGWSAGCNDFGTDTLEIEEDRLLVGEGEGTLIGCDEERHEQDEWLQEVLTAEPTWSLDGDTLTLETDDTVIELEASDDADDTGDSEGPGDATTVPAEPQPDDPPAEPDPPEQPGEGSGDGGEGGAAALEGRTWQVTDLVDGDTVTPVDPGVDATVSINDGGLAIDACNVGNAPVNEITDSELEVEPPIMTMMACGPPQDDVERAIVSVLDGRIAYSVEGDTLTLTHPAGHGVVFTTDD